MSSDKFTGRRGIIPIDTARVCIPGWTLRMEIPGMPYSEPSFGSIVPGCNAAAEKGLAVDVMGVAYLITRAQYQQVIASEGGGIAYRDVRLEGAPVSAADRQKIGDRVWLRTLVSAMVRQPPPYPSARYMVSQIKTLPDRTRAKRRHINTIPQGILTQGGAEAGLPLEYQTYLRNIPIYRLPDSSRTRFGASVFVSIWGPVMNAMEKLTNANMREDGTAPHWVILVVRWVMVLIWLCHDYIFAPIFGPGDV